MGINRSLITLNNLLYYYKNQLSMKFIKCILFTLSLIVPLVASGADGDSRDIDSRYIGTWNGHWLEGMSSGKILLEVKENGGELSFTALPSFGANSAAIGKVMGNEQRLTFHTAGADGRTMRFDLKPSGDFKKLRGKAHYESLHMELELTRLP
jgi:hypothetical protein